MSRNAMQWYSNMPDEHPQNVDHREESALCRRVQRGWRVVPVGASALDDEGSHPSVIVRQAKPSGWG